MTAVNETSVNSAAARPRLSRRARPVDPPRILLLTSGLGSGHVRAADAIECALRRKAPAATVCQLDFWTLMNPGVAAEIQRKYLELVLEFPDLYARLHRLDERTWRRVIENDIAPPAEVIDLIELVTRNSDAWRGSATGLFDWALGPYPTDLLFYPTACAAMPTSPGERAGANVALLRQALLKWAFLRLQGRMEQRLQAFAPDAVVATQMVPAALVAALKRSSRRWRDLPLVGVLTDFGAHDYWAQPGIDRYCVPHESIQGPPLASGPNCPHVIATGVPLMPGFDCQPTRAVARRAIGIDANDGRPVVLVLGGGLGLGLETMVSSLVRDLVSCHVIVMAGRNRAVQQRLRKGNAAPPMPPAVTLTTHGWTDDMVPFLRAADVVVGKSGGLTVAEALACGRPLLVAKTLHGQETFNVRFLERMQVGGFVGVEQIGAHVRRWLSSPDDLAAMQARAYVAGRRDGAERVADAVLELAGGLTTPRRVAEGSA